MLASAVYTAVAAADLDKIASNTQHCCCCNYLAEGWYICVCFVFRKQKPGRCGVVLCASVVSLFPVDVRIPVFNCQTLRKQSPDALYEGNTIQGCNAIQYNSDYTQYNDYLVHTTRTLKFFLSVRPSSHCLFFFTSYM